MPTPNTFRYQTAVTQKDLEEKVDRIVNATARPALLKALRDLQRDLYQLEKIITAKRATEGRINSLKDFLGEGSSE